MRAFSSAWALPNAARLCFSWAGVGQGGAGPDPELAASDCSTSRLGQSAELAVGTAMPVPLFGNPMGLLPFGKSPDSRT